MTAFGPIFTLFNTVLDQQRRNSRETTDRISKSYARLATKDDVDHEAEKVEYPRMPLPKQAGENSTLARKLLIEAFNQNPRPLPKDIVLTLQVRAHMSRLGALRYIQAFKEQYEV